jgi:prepilin-type N-terminal cleavage/methylation domain-containing protein
MKKVYTRKHEEGFTLVELSIVLVIIGLIIGGVLAGQDMIRAAEIRAQVAQLQEFDTAANTFRDKYGYLPGDLPGNGTTVSQNNLALQYSFTQRTGAVGHGDGNGLLESCVANTTAAGVGQMLGCETVLFFRDLNQMNLVDGAFNVATDAYVLLANSVDAQGYVPDAKLKRGNSVVLFSTIGRNYYQITGITSAATTPTLVMTMKLSPQEAANIDNKMDDGKPLTGIVRPANSTSLLNQIAAKTYTANGTASGTAPTGVLADCIDGDTTTAANTVYNVQSEDLANSPSCQLRVRTTF